MKNKYKLLSILIALLLVFGSVNIPVDTFASTAEPNINISKSIDKSEFVEGDFGTLTYTITPTGTKMNNSSGSADIVLVIDVSLGMQDLIRSDKASKLEKATEAAANFLDKLEGTGYNVALVTFGYNVDYWTSLSSNYDEVKKHINEINDRSTFEGTNYDDALLKAQSILNSGSSDKKYVVLLSDGMPNYFTSSKIIKKYNNDNLHQANGVYYLSKWPKNTPEAYNNAKNDARNMGDEGITLYTIGLGSKHEVDMNFLDQLARFTGGDSYQSADENALNEIYNNISSQIINTKLSNISIIENFPEGIAPVSQDNIITLEDGSIQIPVSDIEYTSFSSSPGSFTVNLEIAFTKSGEYNLNQGYLKYTGYDGSIKTKPINNVSIKVTVSPDPPGIEVKREALTNPVVEGQILDMKYTFNPIGVFADLEQERAPADIVIVMDKSLSMKNNKMEDAINAAQAFVDSIAQLGFDDRIAVVSFNRYSTIDSDFTTNYNYLKNRVIKHISPVSYEYDHRQGTNYDIALDTAQKLLKDSNNAKYIVLLSDGEPTYYVDKEADNRDESYYSNYDIRFYIKYMYYHLMGYDEPYQAAYDDYYDYYNLNELNINYGEYTYADEKNIYIETEDKATEVAAAGITLYTVGVGSDDEVDMDFMSELANIGGGLAYGTSDSSELTEIFTNISEDISQQKISNITVTMELPDNVEVLENTGLEQDGNKVTFRIPDIIFVKDEGTPLPVEYTLQLKFNESGKYDLINDSTLRYFDYTGKECTVQLNPITIDVLKADYSISELTATPILQNDIINKISIAWNPDEIDKSVRDKISRFIIERSIDGSNFEQIAEVSKTKGEYIDTDISSSGTYVYRIITIVKGDKNMPDEEVEGATSNAVEVVKQAVDVTLDYSTTDPTNQDVVVTLVPPKGVNITVINNDGSKVYTFTENGEFVFQYRDDYGNEGTITAKVQNIDKTPPICTINYSNELPTNNNVTAEITANETIIITNNNGSSSYEFEQNGSFEFTYSDLAGNKGSITATVNNIDKIAPIGTISYSTDSSSFGTVTATLSTNEPVTITNTDGKSTHEFTENGSYTFTFKDAAGNEGSAVATVNNIVETTEDILSKLVLKSPKSEDNLVRVIQGGSLEFVIQVVPDHDGPLVLALDCYQKNPGEIDYSDMFFNTLRLEAVVVDQFGNTYTFEKMTDGSRVVIIRSTTDLRAGIQYNLKLVVSVGDELPEGSYEMKVSGTNQILNIDVVPIPPLL